MQANLDLNLAPSERDNVHVAEYNWGEEPPSAIPISDIDLVLAADCVYFEVCEVPVLKSSAKIQPAFPLLVTTLCDLSRSNKDIDILFCWKKRRKASPRRLKRV